MQRQHLHPRLQQPFDQHAVRALDRDDLYLEAHQRIAQGGDPSLVMRKRLTQQLVAGVIGDQDIVLLRRPVDPSAITHRSSFGTVRQRPDLEVPLRVLIDKALNGATSCRRSRHLTTGGRVWSFAGPPSRASDRGPLPTVAEAKRSLTYERSSATCAVFARPPCQTRAVAR